MKEMKKLFHSYYQLTEGDYKTLWRDCFFIFDSSVLLNLYRFQKQAKEDYFKILSTIKDRIWIPHQVALEYQSNRLRVIYEQVSKFGEVKKLIEGKFNEITNDLNRLNLNKRHSSINADNLTKQLQKVIENYSKELDTLEKNHNKILKEDGIRDEIDRIFTKIGDEFSEQKQLDEIYKEGASRYENKIPPGFLDIDKKNSPPLVHNGLVYRKEYGDYIIWKEIINKACLDKKFKKIIFITDDDKDDWWNRISVHGTKTIGPRAELIEEIRSKCGVELFHMYNSERFVLYAKQYFDVEINEESLMQIESAKKITLAATNEISNIYLPEILRYLEQKYVNGLSKGGFPFDFFARDLIGNIGIVVVSSTSLFVILNVLQSKLEQINSFINIKQYNLSSIEMVIASVDRDADSIFSFIENNFDEKYMNNINLVITLGRVVEINGDLVFRRHKSSNIMNYNRTRFMKPD